MAKHAKKIRLALQLVIACLVVLLIYLLYRLYPFYHEFIVLLFQICLPFLIAGLIAYLLHPIVEKLHRYHMPRTLAILLIYLIFFGALGIGVYYFFPTMMEQIRQLQANIPDLMEVYRGLIYDLYSRTSFLSEAFHDKLDQLFQEIENDIGERITSFIRNIPVLFDLLIMFAVIPILAFYFLKDYERLGRQAMKIIPRRYQAFTTHLIDKVEDSLGQYLRGQILVCFLVGLAAFLLFKLVGMNYALVLAIIIGLTNFIPYFGPIIGAIPAVLIALTISTKMMIYVLLSVLIVQLLEGNLLSPYIVGRSIHIHPIYLIFVLFLAAKLSGVIGMIFAVPLLAMARVAVPLILQQVKQIDR
ncbi:permease [Gracilibacillus halophilus YIM-C55.5]|uniref:Permease n=1 Tax=Gracilibacillus halophilus YIM-C55.5 TaxID=1308866 RepID=N4WEF4_9BACI|nr:AI-2E family transporter [Gracilibacillus halophilus]ENH97614.1 permease [Gracilibacillus halophilus YIM-C55.5]